MKIGLLGGGNPHALAAARYFSEQGIDCFGIGRNVSKPRPLWLTPDGYRYYQAHIGQDYERALAILRAEDPDVVVNFAAQGERAASFAQEDAWRFYDTNCVMLARFVGHVRCPFIHIGSSEVYGSSDCADENTRINPTSPYGVSKAAFDLHLQIMHQVHGAKVKIIRPTNCVTAGMQLHRIAPRAALAALYGGKLQLQGGGVVKKSFLDSEDLGRAILTVAAEGGWGEVYNCGPDEPTAIRELVAKVAQVSEVPWERFVEEIPARLQEDHCYWLNCSKLKALGWHQTISLEESIARVVRWAKAFPELAAMPYAYRVTP